MSGLLAGDGYIKLGGVTEVVFTGNLRKEKWLYVVVQGELERRFGVKATLYEVKNPNTIVLHTWGYDAVRLLQGLPPLIEPLKELRRQLVLKRGVIGVTTAKRIFESLGDGKRNGEKGHPQNAVTSSHQIPHNPNTPKTDKAERGTRTQVPQPRNPTNPHGWRRIRVRNCGWCPITR